MEENSGGDNDKLVGSMDKDEGGVHERVHGEIDELWASHVRPACPESPLLPTNTILEIAPVRARFMVWSLLFSLWTADR